MLGQADGQTDSDTIPFHKPSSAYHTMWAMPKINDNNNPIHLGQSGCISIKKSTQSLSIFVSTRIIQYSINKYQNHLKLHKQNAYNKS